MQLVAVVSQDGIDEPDVRTLEALLSEADLVKFARLRPGAAEATAALKVARAWVGGFERIEPQPEETEEERFESGEGGAEDVLAELEAVFVSEDVATESADDGEARGG